MYDFAVNWLDSLDLCISCDWQLIQLGFNMCLQFLGTLEPESPSIPK